MADQLQTANPSTPQRSQITERASRRYRDAYLVARATSGIGGSVKFVALLVGVGVVLGGFIFSRGEGPFLYGGIALAFVIAIPLYALGVLVSAHGQVLKASLDEAVHTSPFLTDADRASVMSLE